MDGTLRYFDNPDCHTAEEAYQVTGYCIRVIAGEQVPCLTLIYFVKNLLYCV